MFPSKGISSRRHPFKRTGHHSSGRVRSGHHFQQLRALFHRSSPPAPASHGGRLGVATASGGGLRGERNGARDHRRATAERQLRAGAGAVAAAGDAGARHDGDPVVADVGVRGVHPVGDEAGGHGAGGAGGQLRGSPRERGFDPAAARLRGARRAVRAHVQRSADVRAGGAAQRIGVGAGGGAPHADHVQQQRLGLVRLGLGRRRRRGRRRHPQPRRHRGPRLRPPHRLRRHPHPQPPSPHQQEPGEERGLRGGAVHHPGDEVGGADPVHGGGRALAAAGVDGGVAQGGEVHRQRPLRGAPWAARRRAAGGAGERDRAGDSHRPREAVRSVVHRRRRQQRLQGVADGGGVRREGVDQGGVRVGRPRWRRQARRAAVPRRVGAHPRRLLQLVLQHEERRHELALRAGARRRRRRQRALAAAGGEARLGSSKLICHCRDVLVLLSC